ncbi:hypothetical protein [Microbacterium sp. zg-YB36]|uniref:hypothetical protein n=1 Tax=Microbacterium sp. zg-YB36 TaxID=2969407 RepID=UPI00214B55E4|nr:hypothetical protein [Microbacterium sp. zg-YB36]MDL5351582.1 hypothetical protein [Microbacterium sp. zg-YB36]
MPAKYIIDASHKQFDEATGLPAYPRSTSGTEVKLRRVQKSLQTTIARTEAAIDRALSEFADALDAEDRKEAAQARIDNLTNKRNQRRI